MKNLVTKIEIEKIDFLSDQLGTPATNLPMSHPAYSKVLEHYRQRYGSEIADRLCALGRKQMAALVEPIAKAAGIPPTKVQASVLAVLTRDTDTMLAVWRTLRASSRDILHDESYKCSSPMG